ncbi:hypothetical protein QLH51_19175 [Sphingomonas sp. 2R-10]|nr:hypothetical protein [Sphingomonas sp. 2R-10]
MGLLIVGSAVALGASLFWFGSLRSPVTDRGVIVVSAGRPTPASTPTPQASRIGSAVFPPVPRFDALTGYQRMAMTLSRSRDAAWSPTAETRLFRAIAPTMQGLKLDRIHCAQGACQIIGTLDQGNLSQDDAVRQLLDGGIQRGLRGAGFVENGNMVIDAEGDDRLRFYQYVALPSLIRG